MIRLDTTIKNFHEWPRRPPPSPFCCCRPRQGNSRSSRHSCCTKIEAESSPNTYFVQVASKYGVLLYFILHVWSGATSVQCLDLKWAMRKQQQLQRGRGRQRQLESSYLHCSNVLTKFLELFVLHYLKYVFQVQPQNIKCLMMKVLCFSFLIYSTWDFLGDVHRVLLPINTTDINTELKFGVRIPSLSMSSKSLRQHRYNFLANSHLGVVYWVDISICKYYVLTK